MPKTYTEMRKEFSEAIDDDFEIESEYNDEEEESEVVNVIDQLPGAGSKKVDLPTDNYDQTGDELSDMQYQEVDAVRPIYVRGENGVYTHANEAVELDEISKKTLGSYVKQAHDDAGARERVSGRREGGLGAVAGRRDRADREIQTKIDDRKMKNRRKGIGRAVARLAKEDAEQVDENVLHCMQKVASTNRDSRYRFNDGSVTNISVGEATKMLQTFGSLNPKNQGRFAQMAQESKSGFEKLSEFSTSYKQEH